MHTPSPYVHCSAQHKLKSEEGRSKSNLGPNRANRTASSLTIGGALAAISGEWGSELVETDAQIAGPAHTKRKFAVTNCVTTASVTMTFQCTFIVIFTHLAVIQQISTDVIASLPKFQLNLIAFTVLVICKYPIMIFAVYFFIYKALAQIRWRICS